MITKIREEFKRKFSRQEGAGVPILAVAVLIGAAVCMTVCTLLLKSSFLGKLIPLWLFIGFTVLYLVLTLVPYTADRWWLRLLIFAGVCVVLVLLLVLF